MKAIIGLGNPGQKYARTRHNLGFMVIDELVRQCQAGTPRDRFKAQVWESRSDDGRIVFAKPQTYMNLSGVSVQQVRNWYKLENQDMLVVYDDIDLDFGTLRLRTGGSPGGHNGLASIVQSLGTNEIPRLRIGIGRGPTAATSHVLSGFSESEAQQLDGIVERAAAAAKLWLQEGPIVAMNEVNQRARANRPPAGEQQIQETKEVVTASDQSWEST